MFEFIKNISSTELIIIAVIIFLLFGAGIIRRLAKTSGQSVKEIKNIKKEFSAALDDDKSSKN